MDQNYWGFTEKASILNWFYGGFVSVETTPAGYQWYCIPNCISYMVFSIFTSPIHSLPRPRCTDAPVSLTWVAVDLVLRNDDLAGVGVISVFDWVAEDADHTDHLTCFTDTVWDVAGVTDELLTTRHLQHEGENEWSKFTLCLFWRCKVITIETKTEHDCTSPSDFTPTTFPPSTTISSTGLFSMYVPP